MPVTKINKDGTVSRRSKDLNCEEIYYIRRHLHHGIPKERIAKRCSCEIADVEKVGNSRQNRKL